MGGRPCRALALEVFAKAGATRQLTWGRGQACAQGCSLGLRQSLTGKSLLAQDTFKVEPRVVAVFWMSGERLSKRLQLFAERPRIRPSGRSACPAAGSPGDLAAQEAGGLALDWASLVSVAQARSIDDA